MKIKWVRERYLLRGKNLKIAQKMLEDVTTVLEKHNIRYWIDFGTLLGIVRENRLLPWDDDLDISILADDREKMHNVVMPEIKRMNYRTYSRYQIIDDGILKKDDFRSFKVRNYMWKFFRGSVALDIFVMYKKDDFFYWREFGKKHKIPALLLSEFETIEFNNKLYRKPKDHDKFLTYHYGDWRTPNKDYFSKVDGLKTLSKD